ncbi:unnamed protein product [Closterium sp. NIES-65]|nr:unnamed protein product [Closterium sp. NIES-65]
MLTVEFAHSGLFVTLLLALLFVVTCLLLSARTLVVIRLLDSLCSVRDHFLSLCPTELSVDLLEEHLTAAEKSIVAIRRSGLRLLLVGGAAMARARRARVVEETAGAAVVAVEEAEGVGVEARVVAGVGASAVAVEVVEAAAAVVEAVATELEVAAVVVLVGVELRSMEALAVASASSSRVPKRPRRPSSFVSGTLGVGGLGVLVPALTFSASANAVGAEDHTRRSLSDAWRALFPDDPELPSWADVLGQNVDIFALDVDAILAAK